MKELVIDVFDSASISKAIKEVEKYNKKVKKNQKELMRQLAEDGKRDLKARFDNAVYDGKGDGSDKTEVDIRWTKDGFELYASGTAVYFIEFGAGVYYNRGRCYPIAKPDGILDIGQYGKGNGKKDFWFYSGYKRGTSKGLGHQAYKHKRSIYTHGNPANACVCLTAQMLREKLFKKAKEVYSK